MTHMPGVPVPFDPPSEWRDAHPSTRCPGCGEAGKVKIRTHESSCGGYEDDELRCACAHSWWVEGPDA